MQSVIGLYKEQVGLLGPEQGMGVKAQALSNSITEVNRPAVALFSCSLFPAYDT